MPTFHCGLSRGVASKFSVHWDTHGKISESLLTACVATTLQSGPVVQANTSFESVQRVPPTTKALKQAVTMQPVIVGVDASDWSTNYLNVSVFLPGWIC